LKQEEAETVLEFRPIRYRPMSVRGALKEMKKLSSLMVDLAYSSVLYRDRDLAEGVLELGDTADHLSYLLLMNASLVARDKRDAEQIAGILKAASSIHKMAGAAKDIAMVELQGLSLHPSVQEAFKKVEERLVRTTIQPGSILDGRRIGDLKLEVSIGVDIIAVRRGKTWHVAPRVDFKLAKGDIVHARGSDVGVGLFDRLGRGELKEVP
jgi:uncharacterized protein with PhoU and TrkA domain